MPSENSTPAWSCSQRLRSTARHSGQPCPSGRTSGRFRLRRTRRSASLGPPSGRPARPYLAAGLLDEAQAEIAHGLALATAVKARAYQVPLFRLRAEALPMRWFDHSDEAGRYWRQSLELATDLGMRPELAHAHLGL